MKPVRQDPRAEEGESAADRRTLSLGVVPGGNELTSGCGEYSRETPGGSSKGPGLMEGGARVTHLGWVLVGPATPSKHERTSLKKRCLGVI